MHDTTKSPLEITITDGTVTVRRGKRAYSYPYIGERPTREQVIDSLKRRLAGEDVAYYKGTSDHTHDDLLRYLMGDE